MNMGSIRKLSLVAFLLASTLLIQNPAHGVGRNHTIDILQALGTLLHIPYIYTLDSTDPVSIRIAGILAAIPTDIKVGCKIFEKTNKRFFQVFLWDVPKFGAYSSAAIYDAINVINPNHMVQERQSKGMAALRKMKIDHSINIGIEMFLRIIACIAQYRASDMTIKTGGKDLSFVATLTTELADAVELIRLLSRYNTYSTMPGCDISWNFEIKHIETAENQDDNDVNEYFSATNTHNSQQITANTAL